MYRLPTLLTPKMDGTWRMYVDIKAINKITVQCNFPMPGLNDLLDKLSTTKVSCKIDLKNKYHQICICSRDEWKTAWNQRRIIWIASHVIWLSNAPSTFMQIRTKCCDLLLVNVLWSTLMIYWFIVITLSYIYSMFGIFWEFYIGKNLML